MTFDQTLNLYQDIANREVNNFFDKVKPLFESREEFMQSYNRLRDFCTRGGKKTRPILVMVGYEALRGHSKFKGISRVAVYAELLHNFLLIHDDIMDKDEKRRNGPTIHAWYKSDFESLYPDSAEHLGISLGINDGDLLEILAMKPILDSDFPENSKIRALKEFQETVFSTGLGQKLDVLSAVSEVDEEYVKHVHALKTAHYTFSRPLRVGAIFADAKEDDLKILSDYGLHIGIAFQLRDDRLGLYPDKLGKGKNDLSEGKKTIIVLRALDQLNGKDRKILRECLGKRDNEKVKTALGLIEKTDAFDYNEQIYKEYSKKAQEIIQSSWFVESRKNFLSDLATYVITRES